MKLRLRNADSEPYQLETDLPEARGQYPFLSIQRYAGSVASIALKPGPFLELMLGPRDVELTRGSGRMTRRQEEETLVSTPVTAALGGSGAAAQPRPEKKGLAGRLFGRAKPAGLPLRVGIEGTAQHLLEQVLPVGHYERGAFQGTMLHLYRAGSAIATLSLHAGPVLEIFVINGAALRVDGSDNMRILVSTE